MKIRQTYTDILAIIPKNKHTKLFWFLLKSILFGVVDLLSIAYLIPILILFFDPQKLKNLIAENSNYNINLEGTTVTYLTILLLLLFLVKTIFQTKFNSALYIFLYNLSTELSMLRTSNFINENYIQYQKENKGKVLQSIMTVPEDFCGRFLHSIIFLASEIIVLTVTLTTLLFFYLKITLLVLLILSFFSFFIYFKQKKQLQVINSVYHKVQANANGHLLNILDGFLEIKSSQNDHYFLEKFRHEKKILDNVKAKLISYNFNYSKYLEVCLIVCITCLTFFSFQKGEAIVLFSILGASSLRLIPSISKILNGITMIKTYFYTVSILSKMNNETKKTITPDHFDNHIHLKNINFSYDENQILENCSLEIKKGEFIGIKGDSGIGKTTLLYIILGILKPENGLYFIDKKSIEPGNFLSFANYVPQQPFLFSGSIIENIVMGQEKTKIDYDYIIFLCKKLELHEVIEKLSHGYETKITHNSLRFSGGQKQRLALVRALYTKPSLLILDETTNQQDKALEKLIFSFLKELTVNSKTTIISVSHNKDTDSFFDSVYAVKHNKLEKL